MEFKPHSQEGPKPGLAFNLFVRVFGIAALAALILPYYKGLEPLVIFNALVEGFNSSGINGIPDALFEGSSGSVQGQVVAWMLVSGPAIGILFSLWMVLTGKYAGGPFTFALCFLLLGWIAFTIFKADLDLDMGFLAFVDKGFWAQLGALSIPLVGMFFLDKSI